MQYFANLTIVFFLVSTSLIAQSVPGSIRGSIRDLVAGDDVSGAHIVLEPIQQQTTTDAEGYYGFTDLKPGTYRLIISLTLTKPAINRMRIVQDVNIESGRVTEVTTNLDASRSALQGLMIRSSRTARSEVAILTETRALQTVVNGITASQIGRTLDRDAAQAIRRIPGLTLDNNKLLTIRGLNPRYNLILFHGAIAPSIEADTKSFAMDLVPAPLIEQLLVYKSPSAELPGEFSGGVVNVQTKALPERNFLTIEYAGSYRNGTTGQDFLRPALGQRYWTGFNNQYQNLPVSFPADLNTVANNAPLLAQIGQQLRNNWVATPTTASPDQRLALSGGIRRDLGNWQIGNYTALTYRDTRTTFDIERNDFNLSSATDQAPIYSFRDAQYNRQIRVGLLHNWAVRYRGQSIEWKNMLGQFSDGRYVFRSGRDVEFNYAPANHFFDQVYRGQLFSQLLGQHPLFAGRTKLTWTASLSRANRDQPDYRRYRSDVDEITNQRTLYVPSGVGGSFFLGRFSSLTNDRGESGQINISHRIRLSADNDLELKAGLFYEQKDRNFRARNLSYARSSTLNFDVTLVQGDIANLFAPQNINGTTGIRLNEQTQPSDTYAAANRLLAYYSSINVPLHPKVTLVAGVRIEDNQQTMLSAQVSGELVDRQIPIVSVLPSVNLTYNLSERVLLRAAFGQTVNRPEFRELAPFMFYDFDYDLSYQGNPNLATATVRNLDLRFEWYPTPYELISLSGYYKRFNNPIETVFVPSSGGSGGERTFSFANADQATSAGVELEVRKGLASLSTVSLFRRMTILLNAALIYSQVELGKAATNKLNARPLQGQSPYILNAGLNYADPQSGFQLNVQYAVAGQRIVAAGFMNSSSWYDMPRQVLDINVAKAIGRFQIKAGVSDLLNQPQQFQKQDRSGAFNLTIERYRPGQLFTLGGLFQF